jgi:hypothetical protein
MSERFNVRFATMRELIDGGVISLKKLFWTTNRTPEKEVELFTLINERGDQKILKFIGKPKYIYFIINDRDFYVVYTGLQPSSDPFTNSFKESVEQIIRSSEEHQYNNELSRYGISSVFLLHKPMFDLREAKMEIENLNRELGCLNYRISLDNVSDLEENTNINTFGISAASLLLCVFEGNVCVSSIQMTISKNKITIDTYTQPEKRGNNLNKLLCAVSIIIAKQISPVDYLQATAENPSAAYLLIKYFGASPRIPGKPEGSEENIQLRTLFPEDLRDIKHEQISNIMETLDFGTMDCIVDLNDPNNIQLAYQEFTKTARVINCVRGSSLALGKKTKRKRRSKRIPKKTSKITSSQKIKNKFNRYM